MNAKRLSRWLILLWLCLLPAPAFTQQPVELAATMEVLSPGVEVLRVNTTNWVTINVEAIVGVGDRIRTGETGRARITYFADGVDVVILPNTEYLIDRFEGAGEQFRIAARVILGQTLQRIGRLLDINSTYDINTPGMSLTVRGTEFAVRVEPTGRSALLVSESAVVATAEDASVDVPAGFGVRSEVGAPLSDVVRATTFEQLDSALDGCAAAVRVAGDVRLNVRVGPGIDNPRVGTVDPASITLLLGVSEAGGWYRLPFQGGFGWVLAAEVSLDRNCAGLRVFDDSHTEDIDAYEALGEIITPQDLQQRPPAPDPTDTND